MKRNEQDHRERQDKQGRLSFGTQGARTMRTEIRSKKQAVHKGHDVKHSVAFV